MTEDNLFLELMSHLTHATYIRQFIAGKKVLPRQHIADVLLYAVDKPPPLLEVLLDHCCGLFVSPEVGRRALDQAITFAKYKCVVLLLSRFGIGDYEARYSPLKHASMSMQEFFHLEQARIISILVAAGARPSDIERPQFPDGQDCLFTKAGQKPCTNSYCVRLRAALEPEAITRAQLDLFRHRMTQVCIALQSAHLPALLTVLIIDELIDNSIRMWAKWEIVTATKHYHQRRGIEC